MENPIIFKTFRDYLLQDEFIDMDEFIKIHKNKEDNFYLIMLEKSALSKDIEYEVAIGIKYKNETFNGEFEGYIVRTKATKLIHGMYGFR